MTNVGEGQRSPAFVLSDELGESFDLRDERARGFMLLVRALLPGHLLRHRRDAEAARGPGVRGRGSFPEGDSYQNLVNEYSAAIQETAGTKGG
ncbi:MAG: hypothetical protein AVDCRST_MAG78-1624 [uncultured Rubrobacteraceae bacterium]|uniref:Uncharacterized protein n=1 Tax=uncultured Rubrobacteraceae bacterium TaxID=349277 RepID=A0A6J4PZG2_9ACTN|nr:MAG: hypothetical protein AVDCRST_MAG78-1624 [uncultured Rubrobacteraceae bacterium]